MNIKTEPAIGQPCVGIYWGISNQSGEISIVVDVSMRSGRRLSASGSMRWASHDGSHAHGEAGALQGPPDHRLHRRDHGNCIATKKITTKTAG
jgi:hypothetical protein